MQQEYKEAMEKISLSDSDKKRILANVKKACEESEEKVISMDEFKKRPRFSARQKGMAAAVAVLVVAITAVVSKGFFGGKLKKQPKQGEIVASSDEEEWQKLDSIEAIAKETDCRTYKLGNVSKSYRVKKVEVKKKAKHVKITYRNKKKKDKILFEYKEEENAPDVINQFTEKNELKKEKVDDSEVTMYGDEKCDAMTWQKESCTFAVKMSTACSTDKAKKIVSGTKEENKPDKDTDAKVKKDEKHIASNAVDWSGKESESDDKERRRVLRKIYDMYGFRVTVEDPARKVIYKVVDDFESFSFHYDELSELENQRIVGYAGVDGCPSGVLDGFEKMQDIEVNGLTITWYQNKKDESLFYFMKRKVAISLLIKDWSGENTESMLSGLISVIRISLDAAHDDKGDNSSSDSENNSDKNTDNDDAEATDNADNTSNNESVEAYRQAAQDIQYAVADGSLKKLSSYIRFPLSIKGLGVTVSSAKEFQALDSSKIFTGEWVDAVVSYDTGKIKSSTKSFTMGDGSRKLVCQIKNDSVVITELHVNSDEVQPDTEPTDSPSEE